MDEQVHVPDTGGHTLDLTLDPANPSLGSVTITAQGGDNREGGVSYRINSFFDVFAEFSIDGGPAFDPGSFRINEVKVPEPTMLALFGFATATAFGLRRRPI